MRNDGFSLGFIGDSIFPSSSLRRSAKIHLGLRYLDYRRGLPFQPCSHHRSQPIASAIVPDSWIVPGSRLLEPPSSPRVSTPRASVESQGLDSSIPDTGARPRWAHGCEADFMEN
jgi:hypothetical protein